MDEQKHELTAAETGGVAPVAIDKAMIPAELRDRINQLYVNEKLDRYFMEKSAMMCRSGILPKWLQGDQFACYSILQLAFQWNMQPLRLVPELYKVAADAPVSLSGKTVKAIVDQYAPIADHHIETEYFGDWNKILGKLEERTSKKMDENGYPKKYFVPGWKLEDEIGLGIRLSATLWNGHEVSYELLMTQCRSVRNSTLWAEDPKLQLFYRAVARMARMHFPGIILGIYSTEEVQDEHQMVDVTPRRPEPPEGAAKKSRTASLKDKIKGKAEEPPVEAAVREIEPDALPLSARIMAEISERDVPVTLAEVETYMRGLRLLNGYGIDERAKFPADWVEYFDRSLPEFLDQVAAKVNAVRGEA